MKQINDLLHNSARMAEAKKYRMASARLQAILAKTPLEVAQALDRRCPYCMNYLLPRIMAVKIAGHPTRRQAIFPERCGCQKELATVADEAERRGQVMDRDAQIAWSMTLQRAGLIGWLARATFDSYRSRADWPGSGQVCGYVKEYARALFRNELGQTPWLVLYGAYGSGKSHLAAAVCHDALRQNMDRVFFRPWNEYIGRLLGSLSRVPGQERTQDIMAELQSGRLVVVDDLDKVPPSKSGWIEGQLFTVMNYRYNAALPTIITMNTNPETMVGPVGDRLRGAAFDSVCFDGPSFRGLA